LLRRVGSYWHLTDKPTAPIFVAYWTNNGHRSALGLDLSAAIDPEQTVHKLRFIPPFLRSFERHGGLLLLDLRGVLWE
jgi:hypothetical protein